MAIRAVDGSPGPPWELPLRGALDKLVVESDALASNPLGDPARRPLYVYRSPGVVDGAVGEVASVYVLQGLAGQLDAWLARSAFEPTPIERLDRMFAAAQPACPEGIVVFVDAWTSLGGSQFLNSPAVGNYLDYVCDEVVPFIDRTYPTRADAAHRGVAGKSSGGYGAMVLPMLRPDRFGGLVSHSGDALFEVCYLPDIPRAVRSLRDNFGGSLERFRSEFAQRETFDWGRWGELLNVYAMAAAYSPDLEHPGAVLLPFDRSSGRLDERIWARWLEHDPVRMAPHYAHALRSLRHIHIEAGRADEFHLDLGAQAFSDALQGLGVAHTFELFDGRHGGISYRYPPAIRALLEALSAPTPDAPDARAAGPA